MNENQSIIKRTESARDDFIDLWKRRPVICTLVLAILIAASACSIYLKFHRIPKLELRIDYKVKEISQLKKEREEALEARDKAELQLGPFFLAAERSFPKAPVDQRLDLLMDKFDEMATAEKQEKMLAILERMQSFVITDHDVLSNKYPEGYYLFASNKYIIIPSNQEITSHFSLKWEDSKVKIVDNDFIYIFLKKFHYFPVEGTIENLNIVLERKIGAIADGIFFDKFGLYVELLDNRIDELIYVIGFRKVESYPESRKLKPNTKAYFRKSGLGRHKIYTSLVMTRTQKVTVKDWVVTSGWE